MGKKFISIILALVFSFSIISLNGIVSYAAGLTEAEFQAKLDQVRSRYPDGCNDDTYTWYVGNTVVGWQCHGYARWISYYVWGVDFANGNGEGWSLKKSTSTSTYIDSLVKGDVVRYRTSTSKKWNHTIFITSISGNDIYYTDCNSDGNCTIHWNQHVTKSTLSTYLKVSLYGNEAATYGYIAHYSYNSFSNNTSTPDPEPSYTVDSRYPVPFKSYLISTENVRCYNEASLSTSPGLIYPTDDCVITAVYTNGVIKCNCPWGSSTKTVYVSKSAFINSTMTPSTMTAPQFGVTYLRSDGATSKGNIDAGDSITKVAVSGSYTQVIYPCGDGLRCAWVLSSVLVQNSALSLPQFNCYTISTENVRCYNEPSLSTSPGLIWPEDDCLITAVYENGVIQCNCPWDNGSTTKTVYVSASEFLMSYSTPKQMIAPNTALTYLRTGDANNKGYIDPGDSIYVLGTSGSMTQIIYPSSSSGTMFRCAWVYTSDLNKTYIVSYNANGGQGAPDNQTKNYDVNLVLSSTIPTRTGYTFLGWSETSSATAATYGAGGIYTKNEAKTLYAVWKANQYNVSYNANGGQNAPEPQVKIHGIALTLSTTQPTRVGYTFSGWAASPDAATAQYSAGDTYAVEGAATLYAVWNPNTYTLTYNANGGINSPVDQTKKHGETIVITFDEPSRDGYTFLGWAEVPNATVPLYLSGELFDANENKELYAIWEEDVPEYVSGDVNGDDVVNNKDLTRLMKYLAGEDVAVQESALDVNGDGTINNKDLTRLMKYLAGEDVTIY